MTERDITYSGGGCGCFSFILFVLVIWALLFGLPTSLGTLNIDLFPPCVYLEQGD